VPLGWCGFPNRQRGTFDGEAHRAWIEAAFADEIARGGPALTGQLIALCGVELWLVLRRDGGLTPEQARDTVANLIRSVVCWR
jgi:hypothetical protein